MLKFFRLPFATTGDKTAVPDPVDTNGNVSYSQGYGFDYQRQKTDPAAKNIERDKMNQIFFDVTTALAELQSQGIPDFITTALNGGTAYSYAIKALVRWTDGDLYISLAAANTADPTDATKWAKLPTPARLQSAFNTAAVAAGTANALTGAFSPAIAELPTAPATLFVMVRAGGANTVTNPTFSPDGLTAKDIVKYSNVPLVPGDIGGAGHWLLLMWDATLDKWVLLNPANADDYVSATLPSTTPVSLTNLAAANVTSVSLGAGTWEVNGQVAYVFGATTSVTRLRQGASNTSATMPTSILDTTVQATAAQVPTNAVDSVLAIPNTRFVLAAPATIYLVAQAGFTASTCAAYGTINAKRITTKGA